MKKINIPCFLIFLAGLILRLWRIDLPLLEFEPSRQIQTAEITKNLFHGGFNLLRPEVNYYGPGKVLYLLEFPVYNSAVASLYLINGAVNETLGRLFSVLGWGVSFLFLYKISSRLIGPMLTLIAVLFYSFSPMSVFVSRSFQPDQWMITLSLAAIYFFLVWIEKKKFIFLIISALFASIASLIKIPSFFFTIIPVLLSIFIQKNKYKFFNLLFYALISLLPSIIWYLYAYFVNRGSSLVSQEGFSVFNWFWPYLFFKYKYYMTVFGWNYNQVILPIGFVLFTIGLFTGDKKLSFIYFWLFGVALYFLIFNRHTMVHEYYNLPFLPVASIFIAIGFMKTLRIFRNNLFVYLFVFCMILIGFLPQIFTRAYQPIDRFKFVTEAGKEVKELTKPEDLIIGSMDSGPAVVFYSKRNGWGFDMNGNNNPLINGQKLNQEEYLEYLKSKGAVVFAVADKNRFLSNKNFAKYMYSNYKTLEDNPNYVIFDLNNSENKF